MRISDLSEFGWLGQLAIAFAGLASILAFVVHLYFSAAVYRDADRHQRARGGPMFVGPFTWALAVLFTGIAGVAGYWVIHHSTLRPPRTQPAG